MKAINSLHGWWRTS
ncbi:trp operon leader peptide [Enterobacteriaceae bacterium RIT693]|nr:trp operon leader peptide [Enterobacteriaceae bacterium RIT693]